VSFLFSTTPFSLNPSSAKVAKFDEHALENEKTVETLLDLAKKVSTDS
jgi:hypothetical protein